MLSEDQSARFFFSEVVILLTYIHFGIMYAGDKVVIHNHWPNFSLGTVEKKKKKKTNTTDWNVYKKFCKNHIGEQCSSLTDLCTFL